MSGRLAVVYFPGSNCEHDVASAWETLGGQPNSSGTTATSIGAEDAVVLPGGFATATISGPAIARFSPVMAAVARFAAEGGPVVGICNGFQVLTEAGLLPGALRRNAGLRFLCRTVECEVASTTSVLTTSTSQRSAAPPDQPLPRAATPATRRHFAELEDEVESYCATVGRTQRLGPYDRRDRESRAQCGWRDATSRAREQPASRFNRRAGVARVLARSSASVDTAEYGLGPGAFVASGPASA